MKKDITKNDSKRIIKGGPCVALKLHMFYNSDSLKLSNGRNGYEFVFSFRIIL